MQRAGVTGRGQQGRGQVFHYHIDVQANAYRYDRLDRPIEESGFLSQSFTPDPNANRL